MTHAETTQAVGIVATMEARPDSADAVADLLAKVVQQTKAEDGCLMYDVHRQIDAPERFVFFERWSGPAALAAHMQVLMASAEMKAIGGMLASRPTIVKLAPLLA